MQKVIISILHYNSNRDTVACLNSLLEANFKEINVKTYVLDNGSNETLDVDLELYKPIGLTLLKSGENLGFTGGHNLVYSRVKNFDFDFFLLLNNDSVVERDFLTQLLAGFSDNVGGTVPKIYFTKGMEYHKSRYSKDEEGRVIWYAGGYFDWDNVMSVHRGVDEVDHGQYNTVSQTSFATGACFLIKNEVLKDIGLFDKRYFLYYEDADLSLKITSKGLKIMYIPDAIVWHNNAGSSGSGSELHDYYLSRNRMLFGMKFSPLKTKVALTRESLRLLYNGRKWQKRGIKDYYLRRFGRGSYRRE